MSLDRFSNKEEIIVTDGKLRGIEWKEADQVVLQLDEKSISPTEVPTLEVHLYTPGSAGRYIAGGEIDNEQFKIDKDELFVDWAGAANDLGIERGQFEVVVNVHKNVIGEEGENALYVKEISDDRRELHICAAPGAVVNIDAFLESFGEQAYYETVYETQEDENGNDVAVLDDNGSPIVKATIERPMSDDIALNFGENKVYKIINCKDWNEENDFVVRTYQPIPDTINAKDFLWVVEELTDSYVDNIEILGPGYKDLEPKVLRGPNLQVSKEFGTVTETDYKSWNQLLDAKLSTSQQIVDTLFSGSLMGVDLGIDYSAFDNFINFSSAKERVQNFKTKLELIEYYDKAIYILENSATGTDADALQGNIAVNNKRKDRVIGSFDGFEKWLYSEPTSSLSTHGVSGSLIGAVPYHLTPWPKYVGRDIEMSSNPDKPLNQRVHHTTHSLSETWYTGFIETASLYDVHNEKSLAKSIPEHIRLDSNNEQYELFVNMIGHHYDILYSYIENLTRLYKPEDQPKLGQSKEVLYQIAESMGWTLANGKQASQLWKYKLGTDTTGSAQTTGSMFSKSDEAITTEVWRRIVNNLPYLLKTKGTTRSIKALMNTYGIPQTLLSIREYGGPKVGENAPLLIEDRFNYALQFVGSGTQTGSGTMIGSGSLTTTNPWGGGWFTGSHLEIPNQHYSSSKQDGIIGVPAAWGIPRGQIPALTREFRFRPATTASMLLYTNAALSDNPGNRTISPLVHIALEHTQSYSGSAMYGRIHLVQGGAGTGSSTTNANLQTSFANSKHTGGAPMTASTDWTPIYDGNFWNLRYYYTPTSSLVLADTYYSGSQLTDLEKSRHLNAVDNLSGKYVVQVQQASDYFEAKLVHSASCEIYPETASHWRAYSTTASRYDKAADTSLLPSSWDGYHRSFLGGHWGQNLLPTLGDFDTNCYLTASLQPDNRPHLYSFTGSMQEYREWLEVLDQRTFDLHTLNPTSYVSSISPTSSYSTLVRHYPLGTEFIAVDRSVHKIVTSSHPAQRFYDDFSPAYEDGDNAYATASNFIEPLNAQRGNYIPVEETYYVQGVSLGGNLPKSQKIRLENNKLFRMLSPQTSAERSSFDLAPLDSNKLGLFYSHADQLNKEIFNHIGDVALDDFVGDPDDEYLGEYPDLEVFSKEYFKKYTDANDVNAYIRIFSQFDFALFEQIKQLLPERVDEAMGLLVEPHALERAKVILTRRPQKEEPFYDGGIPAPESPISGGILPLEATVQDPLEISTAVTHLHATNAGYSQEGNYYGNFSIYPGSSPSSSADYCLKEVFPSDMTPQYTASIQNVYEVVHEGQNTNAIFPAGGNSGLSCSVDLLPLIPNNLNHWQGPDNTPTLGVCGDSLKGFMTRDAFAIGTNKGTFTQGPNGPRHINFTANKMVCRWLASNAARATSNKIRFECIHWSPYDTIVDFDVNFVIQDNTAAIDYTGSMFAKIIITGVDTLTGYNSSYYQHNSAVAGPGLPSSVDFLNAGSNAHIVESSSLQKEAFFRTRTVGHEQVIDIGMDNQIDTKFNIKWKDVKIPKRTKPQIELFIHSDKRNPSNGAYVASQPTIREVNPIISVKKVCFLPTHEQIDQCRHSDIFREKKFYYGFSGGSDTTGKLTKIGRSRMQFISQSQGAYIEDIYPSIGRPSTKRVGSYPGNYASASHHHPACYRDDFMQATENLYFEGCKLRGPGINVPSTNDAIDRKPVIEVFNVNPNQLVFQRDPQDGVPGNLRVR